MTLRPIRFLALLGAVALVVGACGGEGAEPAPTLPSVNAAEADQSTTTTAPDIDPEEAFQLYSECMRENGIDLPDPGSVGGEGGGAIFIGGGDETNFDFEAFEEAAAECDPILEDAFGEFEMTPEMEAEIRDQELAFARCMRDNGIDWPDPSGDPTGGVSIELPDDIDAEQMNAAMETCSKEAFGTDGGIVFGSGDATAGNGGTP